MLNLNSECLNIYLNILFLFCSFLLCLDGSESLTNLPCVVQNHCGALASNGHDQVITATCLDKLTGRVVAPAMYIKSNAPIFALTFLTAWEEHHGKTSSSSPFG